jgi:hypothetical protein
VTGRQVLRALLGLGHASWAQRDLLWQRRGWKDTRRQVTRARDLADEDDALALAAQTRVGHGMADISASV